MISTLTKLKTAPMSKSIRHSNLVPSATRIFLIHLKLTNLPQEPLFWKVLSDLAPVGHPEMNQKKNDKIVTKIKG